MLTLIGPVLNLTGEWGENNLHVLREEPHITMILWSMNLQSVFSWHCWQVPFSVILKNHKVLRYIFLFVCALCFQWSLRLRNLLRTSSVTSRYRRWRAKKDVSNTPSMSTNTILCFMQYCNTEHLKLCTDNISHLSSAWRSLSWIWLTPICSLYLKSVCCSTFRTPPSH